jgi:hypothetical protein
LQSEIEKMYGGLGPENAHWGQVFLPGEKSFFWREKAGTMGQVFTEPLLKLIYNYQFYFINFK